MGPGQLRAAAGQLLALASRLDAATGRYERAGDELTGARADLAAAWRSPRSTQLQDGIGTLATLTRGPAAVLRDTAGTTRQLAATVDVLARQLASIDARTAATRTDLARTSASLDADPAVLAALGAELRAVERERAACLAAWTDACRRARPVVESAIAELTETRSAAVAARSSWSPTTNGAAGGAAGGAAHGGDRGWIGASAAAMAGLFALLQHLTTFQDVADAVWALPALGRTTSLFHSQVLRVPPAQRLTAFLRWQSEVSHRVPLPLAIGELERRGLLDPSYARTIRDVPTAPNLSAFARVGSGLRLLGRIVAPVALFADGRTLLAPSTGTGDRVAALGGAFAGGVGTAALLGMAIAPPVAIAAAAAGVGALTWTAWQEREAIAAWAGRAWDWTTGAVSSAWDATTGAAGRAWDWTTNTASSAWNWTADAASGAWNWGTDAASGAWNWTANAASSAWDRTTSTASSAWDWGTSAASSAWDWSTGAVSGAWGWLRGAGSQAAAMAADVWHWTAASARTATIAVRDTAGAVLRWSRDHVPGVLTGGRVGWWVTERTESLFGTASPHPTPFDDVAAMQAVFGPLGIAAPTDPGEVAAIFARLDPATAERLALSSPALIGALDGAPAALRDLANRLHLEQHLAVREAELARLDAQLGSLVRFPGDPWAVGLQRQRDALAAEVEGLRLLRRDLDDQVRSRQLLLFQPDRGHVAVATGDVDLATHVTTLVPGTGVGIGSIPSYLEQTTAWRDATVDRAPGANVAHVVWLGYDSPPNLLAATDPRGAQRGGPALSAFVTGLRVNNPEAHLVAAGHSYGSSVVGEGATTRGLDVDALLLIASPGGRAASASDYHLRDGAPVYVATDTRWLPSGEAGWGGDVIHAVSGGALTGRLGPDPTSPAFGGTVLDVSDGGWHAFDGYVGPDTLSLGELARISAGQPLASAGAGP